VTGKTLSLEEDKNLDHTLFQYPTTVHMSNTPQPVLCLNRFVVGAVRR
jgi:hypothetical protein